MADYPPNSYKSKEEKTNASQHEKAEVIIKGKTTTQKKTIGQKLVETFIAEDISNVRTHVVKDVIVPKIIDILINSVTEGLTMLFRGRSGARQFDSNSVYYNKPSSVYHAASNSVQTNTSPVSTRSVFEYVNIVYESQQDAENVLTDLIAEIDQYGSVSVAHLYEVVGRDTTSVDFKYGWKNLASARTDRVVEGYILKLPRAVPL